MGWYMLNLITMWTLLRGSREERDMMAMLWAQQVMLGKKTYAQVPRLLKEQVREILMDSGMGELVEDD